MRGLMSEDRSDGGKVGVQKETHSEKGVAGVCRKLGTKIKAFSRFFCGFVVASGNGGCIFGGSALSVRSGGTFSAVLVFAIVLLISSSVTIK